MPEHENESMAAEQATAAETESDGWDDLEESEGLEGGFGEENPETATDAAAGTGDGGEDEKTDGEGEGQSSEEQEKSEETAGAAGKEPEYTITYNGQQIPLPVSQLTRLAQQGMNYDPVYQRMTAAEQLAARQAPMVEIVQQMAAVAGMTLEQYLAQGPAMLESGFVDQQTAAGIPEATARQMWQDKLRLARFERDGMMRQANDARRQAESEAAAAQRAEFEAFIREYPDVQRLPQEVIAIKQQTGESITSAYRKYELDRMRTQLAARKAEQDNRRRAPASAAGVGRQEQTDAFLDGWDNPY